MSEWFSCPETLPPVGRVVLCRIYNPTSILDLTKEVELIHVDADDYTWATADDMRELDEWNWTVKEWTYK